MPAPEKLADCCTDELADLWAANNQMENIVRELAEHGLGSGGSSETILAPHPAASRAKRRQDEDFRHLIEEVLALTPFAQHLSRFRASGSIRGDLKYAVAIPVRNEEDMLPRALAALERAMAGSPENAGGLVVVVNDSTDGSAGIVSRWARDRRIAHVVIEADFAPQVRNAPHARRLALDLAARLASKGAVFTTDADSHVGSDWIAHGLARIASGADMVCEDVRLDKAEESRLHERVRLVGSVERAYFEASEQLWQAWTHGRAGRFAYRASGASLALRTAAYLEAGRLPLPQSGEDRALCDAMLRNGFSVEVNSEGQTRTSARLVARAVGGCASALADRERQLDPMCDAALIPVEALRERSAQTLYSQRKRTAAAFPPSSPMRFTQVLRELATAIDLLKAGS
jgi:hypothetical protein